jgi:hypothetical protein
MALWCGELSYISLGQESWYKDLNYILHHGTCSKNLNPRERRALGLKSAQYHLISSILFWINYDGVLLICIEHEDADTVPKELHDGPAGGHFVGNTTTHKILRDNYYWHTLFKDAHTYPRNYKTCQMSTRKEKKETIPLQPMTFSRHFEQWGLDIIGEITPSSSKQHKYILTAINYFTKWEDSIPLTHLNEKVVIKFIEQ